MSRRDRRTLGVGVAVVALLAFGSRVLPAALTWRRDAIAAGVAVSKRVRRDEMEAKTLPARRDTLAARRARLTLMDTTLLMGKSPAEAAAFLAAAVGDIADASLVKVAAMQLRSDTGAAGGLVHVFVRIAGTTDVAGLAAFLREAEAGVTPLVVRELVVNQPEPAAADNRPEALRIDVLIESIARVSGAPAPVTNSARSRGATAPSGQLLLTDAEEAIVGNDPFRLSNTPARVRFDPDNDGSTAIAPVTVVVRPLLQLKAIVGGPPWRAIIDGIPGQVAGTIAEQGNRFDHLLVRSVARDSVVVQGADTVWVLRFRKL